VQQKDLATRSAQIRLRTARKTATILLVEDEWFLLEGLSDLLGVFDGDYELSILTAGDGKQALQVLEEQEPDLIITDIMMPRMDGYELLREVRKNPAWLQIPFIFLTAKGERGDIVRGRTSGAEEYVTKPYDANELFAVIKTQLDRHFQRKGAVEQYFKDLKQSILDLLLDDLRMPLNIVSDYTEKIAENVNNLQSDQDLVVYLRGIQSGSSQVSRLVQDFMLLVELQTGKSVDWFALQARPTDVNTILSDIPVLGWDVVNQPQVDFRIDLDDGPGSILIDPELLMKCIERLVGLLVALGNEYGEIEIALSTRQTNDRIQITVGTTAVSLTEDEAEKVNTLLAKSDPVVLELSEYDPALLITKGIVHHHEGTVNINVIENERLDFVVSFPVYQPLVEAYQINS
jgi:CheY-like chemotaxis protein